jgi:hypothetical protein
VVTSPAINPMIAVSSLMVGNLLQYSHRNSIFLRGPRARPHLTPESLGRRPHASFAPSGRGLGPGIRFWVIPTRLRKS